MELSPRHVFLIPFLTTKLGGLILLLGPQLRGAGLLLPCAQQPSLPPSPQGCFMMPQSLGVIGGKPNSAHYFIGYVGEW